MANSIALAQKFLPFLDEVYKRESLTSRLDFANGEIEFIGANVAKIAKMTIPGLGDYSRAKKDRFKAIASLIDCASGAGR